MPALVLIDRLLSEAQNFRCTTRKRCPTSAGSTGTRLVYGKSRDDVLAGADALAIMTEWKEFVQPDLDLMRARCARR